jgi:hypothetical protein
MSTHIINFPGADIHTTTITSVSNVSVGENLDVTSNLTVSGNTVVSQELTVSGNVEVGTANLFVDTTTGNVGVGVAHPTSRFEVAGTETLQEYPPKAMTGYETYMEGHGVFKASASSTWSTNEYEAFGAFNKTLLAGTPDLTWNSVAGGFSSGSDYAYTGTNSLGGISGEWLKLSTPYAINPSTIKITVASSYINNYAPEDFYLLGSVDDATWYVLAQETGETWSSLSHTSSINTTNTYKYFALVVTKTRGADNTNVTEMQVFGTPAPSSLEDGHMTLGKALTLPRVSGHPAGAETPRAESLVVHYDTTVDSVVSGSTVVDVSGNGTNGTLTNGAAYSSTDQAFTFDGTDDRITGTLNNPSGAWVNSIAFWFKRDVESGVNGYDYVFKSGTQGGTSAMNIIITPSDQLVWTIYNHTVYTPSNIIENNRWYHVLTVYRGGVVNLTSVDIYVNGVNIANSTNGTAAQTLPTNSGFVIANNTTSGYNFNGSISNFKIWGGVALTAEEVAMEYALGRTGKSLNLTDTSLCLGGTVPRAQLDVRGTVWGSAARFGGDEVNIADWGTTDSAVSIYTTDSTVPLSVYRGTESQDVPAIRIAVDSKLSATVGDYWRAIDFNTEDFRQCGINLINYNTTGTGQYNIPLRRKTGIGFTVSASDGANKLENAMVVRYGGNVGIGVTNPVAALDFGSSVRNRIINLWGSDTGGEDSTNFYGFGINGSTLRYNVPTTSDAHRFYGGSTQFGYVNNGTGFVSTFTGQHKSFPHESLFGKTSDDLCGLIVSASGEYISINDKVPQKGQGAIQVSEAIPTVKLSTSEKDKKVFGVISDVEDVETSQRHDRYGAFVSTFEKEPGDSRIYVNSIGEGAMWVVNTAGALESGDYITTSNVAGYGQRQDDDILHNYTVAKITMDCDFNPLDIPVQRILKELSNVNYWVKTTYSNVSLEEYSNLAEENRTTTTETVYTNEDHEITTDKYNTLESNVQSTYTELTRIIHQKMSTEEYKTEQEGTTLEVRQELVNVLDEHGQLQWEDHPTETEKTYKIRYLDTSGQITDEANAVHIAAFVGCTYHCG